jgi:putative membrane protein
MPDDLTKDPRVYFAAERTFLAWVRTGIAIMGFGFVVARFGLFLRELRTAQSQTEQQNPRLSLWIGIAMLVIGVAVNISAAVRQGRLVERLKQGEWEVSRQSRLGVAIVVTLTGFGLAMAAYLILMH